MDNGNNFVIFEILMKIFINKLSGKLLIIPSDSGETLIARAFLPIESISIQKLALNSFSE